MQVTPTPNRNSRQLAWQQTRLINIIQVHLTPVNIFSGALDLDIYSFIATRPGARYNPDKPADI